MAAIRHLEPLEAQENPLHPAGHGAPRFDPLQGLQRLQVAAGDEGAPRPREDHRLDGPIGLKGGHRLAQLVHGGQVDGVLHVRPPDGQRGHPVHGLERQVLVVHGTL